MKIIYEFDPIEDREDLEIFQKAVKNHIIIDEIQSYVRSLVKYDQRVEIPIEELSDKIYKIISGEE